MSASLKMVGMTDRLAIGLSGLCLVHCLASTILLAVLSAAGSVLLHPSLHEIGLGLALPLGVIALGRGILDHGYMLPSAIGGLGLGIMAGSLTLPHGGAEVLSTIFGACILALGHDLNRRACI